jgi:hypothetical protein
MLEVSGKLLCIYCAQLNIRDKHLLELLSSRQDSISALINNYSHNVGAIYCRVNVYVGIRSVIRVP